ncbi:3-oxoacyl-[acyl-carrier-protein] synthase III C-terminal domain-containing protein [Amycolatopsis solani]|uniref:3-oxoacyl-[acyl-carrier-protein] synthase III C-terminal domain-containing protein n=1 Tax=Amycolatopsis solani TaxID=3028615 RepID=UPI0025B03BE3|nr:3-oxoacyl-[acyl-carrier-protein] synthase III C-terminal domain-containing protein [Amycolatopsis sp. MEP2-6]
MTDVYVDHLVHAMGELKAHVTESGDAELLRSSSADLASAGFEWHHRCAPGTTAYDLAAAAVRALPEAVLRAGIDAIVYATCLPGNGNVGDEERWRASGDVTYLMDFPASRLQADFGLGDAVVLGLTQQGCTTMLGALRVARALLLTEPGWRRVLCVTADRFPAGSRYEHSYNLISDSAAACLVGTAPSGFRLVASHHITNGGLHQAGDDETLGSYFSYVTLLIGELLDRAGLTAGDIAWVVPQNTHRAAWQILPRLVGIAADRVWQPSLPDNGHAISADNIVNLASLAASGRAGRGDLVLLVVAGYGLNWQAVVLEAVEERP